jgi:hypothetical protein
MRCFIFLFCLAVALSVKANVSIQLNNQLQQFEHNPRLAEVLAKVATDKQWYWPAAALYRLDSSQTEQQRYNIIEKLKLLRLSLSEQHGAQVTYLIEQIKLWQLADRVNVAIDFDGAQMNANNNPRFENGSYRLDLILRPTAAQVIGLTTQSLSVDLTEAQCAHQYIHQLVPYLANKDFVYLIQPNGISKKIGIAYWNANCVDIMPGSQIFLPLAESQFFHENRLLNEQIVALAKNRIFL